MRESFDDEDEDDDPVEESRLLARTLSNSPYLGYLVRRLVLLTYAHNYRTTKDHIEILRQCPLVEDLKIWGYNGYCLKEYKPVVAGLRCLRTLNICRRCLRDWPTDLFVDDGEYLDMVKEFPRLEYVMVPSMIYDYWSRKALKKYFENRGIGVSWAQDDY